MIETTQNTTKMRHKTTKQVTDRQTNEISIAVVAVHQQGSTKPNCRTEAADSSSWGVFTTPTCRRVLQDDYMEALGRLHLTVSRAYKVNPDINFEVFIHKVDGLSDDHKIETQRDVHQRANDDLADASLEKVHLSFYLTSIYDHSIFEAFSKVVQKLIPQLPTLENLLNIFISHSGIEKAFLFDVVSKIYIATDSSPVDMQSYELCCDMIDVVIDVSCIYGLMDDGGGCAYDRESLAIIKLNNTTVLYLKEVTKFLALVCILREESFERKAHNGKKKYKMYNDKNIKRKSTIIKYKMHNRKNIKCKII
uniref:Ras-related GTP-binding protein n=1 Tax=Acanthochromis polyacanthus TaxID=80966 RepID=A0A3Q1F2J4_9TELE